MFCQSVLTNQRYWLKFIPKRLAPLWEIGWWVTEGRLSNALHNDQQQWELTRLSACKGVTWFGFFLPVLICTDISRYVRQNLTKLANSELGAIRLRAVLHGMGGACSIVHPMFNSTSWVAGARECHALVLLNAI
jgi:hypothetical protein